MGYASVRLPGVLQTNLRHIVSLDIESFIKFIRSDISAFVQGHCQIC